jgi:hypothetical protein
MKYQKCRRHGEPKNVNWHERHERINASIESMQKGRREKKSSQKEMMHKMKKMSKKWKMNLQKMKL